MRRTFLLMLVGGAIFVSFTRTAAAQTVQPTPTSTEVATNTSRIAGDLGSRDFWETVLAALVAGAFGGLVYELITLKGNFERPHKPDAAEKETFSYAVLAHVYDLGVFARVIIGALAGIIVLPVIAPLDAIHLFAASVVAGSAGVSVFRSLQDRLLASLAQKDAEETRDKLKKQGSKAKEAKEALDRGKAEIHSKSFSPAGSKKFMAFAGSETEVESHGFSLDKLDDAAELLSQAIALGETD